MSGVVAVLDRTDGAAPQAAVDPMLEALAHRGPDGTGRWFGSGVGLGHQLHATTPEALEASPPEALEAASERDGTLVVTADVRLDNRAALCRTLDVDGNGTVTDSELLLRAYDRWGVDCAVHLLGAFAFALWDGDRGQLYCARDHVGVKPLYVADTGERFVAASEPGPVLDRAGVSQAPDEHRIGDFLIGHYAGGATFYEGLDRVPPGHWSLATADGVRTEQYWSPASVDPDALAGVTDYERRFRELFTDAVAARLRTARPPGSLLSGGLDSSSIATVADELLTADGRPPLRTFSAVFDEITACDERAYVDAVHESGRFEPHYVHGDRLDPLADLDDHVEHRRAPFYPSLFVLIWGLYREVGQSDAAVVMQGYGGDQTMGSDLRGYLRGLARRGQLRTLADEIREYADRYPGLSPRDVLWNDVLKPLAPGPVRSVRRALHDSDPLASTMVSIDRSFAERTGLDDRLAADARQPPPRSQRELRRSAVEPGEPTFNLELNDVAGAYFGVEPRYPYFDRRLIEFSLALPPGETVRDGLDRTIVRDALAGTLPDAVRERSDKMEFSPNVVHCARTYAMDRIERTLFDGRPDAARYLDVDGLRRSLDRLQSEGDVGAARDLLLSTTLETWLRDHAELPEAGAARRR